MASSIRYNKVTSSKDDPITIEVPEGYNLLLETIPKFSFCRSNYQLILGSKDKSITLSPGNYYVTLIKDEQEVEYTRSIVITNDYLRNSVARMLLTVRFNTTQMTYMSAAVLKMYSAADPGFISELDDSIDIIISKICEAKPQINDQNIEIAKKLIEQSIMRVIRDYALKNQQIEFTQFSKNSNPEQG